MSRIIYSDGVAPNTTLLKDVIAQNALEPNTLKIFLPQKEIVLDDDLDNLNKAALHESRQFSLSGQSENNTQLRDLAFNGVFKHVTGIAQFLKKLMSPNFKSLGDWGIPITTTGRINYPADIVMRMNIFNEIKTKHDSYAAGESPLAVYLTKQKISLDEDAVLIGKAKDLNTSSKELNRASENETQQKELLLNLVSNHLHLIGDFLKSLYGDNTKGLTNWGFVVDNSPQKPKKRTTKLKPGAKKTTNGVVIGSILTNVGNVDIQLHKGRIITDTPVTIKAGEKFGIQKGFSIITLVNPNTLEQARFTVIVTK